MESKIDLEKRLEDSRDKPGQLTTNELIENDFEMMSQGFEFEPGELDWYLKRLNLSLKNRRRLIEWKRIKGI